VFNRLISLASVALAALVVVLAWQNLHLKRQLAEQLQPRAELEAGDRLGPIRLVDTTGAPGPSTVDENGGRTVLLFFTPTCPACRATVPVWQELFASPDPTLRVLGVNLGSPGENHGEVLVTAGLPFPVFGVEPEHSQGLHDINLVPATVLVDGRGIVEQAWFGELDGDRLGKVRQALAGG
jgi:hypothetical protein